MLIYDQNLNQILTDETHMFMALDFKRSSLKLNLSKIFGLKSIDP